MNGEVIGINTAIYTQSADTRASASPCRRTRLRRSTTNSLVLNTG